MLSWKKNVGGSRQLGFTLVELLVALFVFALMSGFAYRAVNMLMASGREIDTELRELATLQRAFLFWERDVRQFADHSAHQDDAGSVESAATGSMIVPEELGEDGVLVEFSRVGGASGIAAGGQLEHIQYALQKGVLYRQISAVDIIESDASPSKQVLLTGVSAAKATLLGEIEGQQLPAGVELSLTHRDFGLVGRKIHLALRRDLAMLDPKQYGQLAGILPSASGKNDDDGKTSAGGNAPAEGNTDPNGYRPPPSVDPFNGEHPL